MRSRWVIVLALIAMLWQGLAGASVVGIAGLTDEPEHVSLHWQEVGHHHDDDGLAHQDDTVASVLHVAMDGSHGQGAGAVPPFALVPVNSAQSEPRYRAVGIQTPYLDPFRRPPRALT